MSQRVAAKSSFAEYVEWFLSGRPDVISASISNFQTIYLSGEQHSHEEPRAVSANARAFDRAEAVLEDAPVFGIVERFEESVCRFERQFKQIFPEVRWQARRENMSGSALATLQEIREELGDELYGKLASANEYDLALYRLAEALFAAASRTSLS